MFLTANACSHLRLHVDMTVPTALGCHASDQAVVGLHCFHVGGGARGSTPFQSEPSQSIVVRVAVQKCSVPYALQFESANPLVGRSHAREPGSILHQVGNGGVGLGQAGIQTDCPVWR